MINAYSNDRPLIDEEADRLADTVGVNVFVYGTLKRNHGNSHLLKSASFLGRCYIEGRWKIYDTGYFPCVVRLQEGAPSRVVGEVYKVNLDTLRTLDMLEGHPNWYERVQVDTPWNQAWVYTLPSTIVVRAGWKEIDKCWRPNPEETDWMKTLCS
jgi:gamma-glutamylcyclotransferase (GGCT)/AIG2-like uncharacterized protein YtfP